jgi:hypothetical protein
MGGSILLPFVFIQPHYEWRKSLQALRDNTRLASCTLAVFESDTGYIDVLEGQTSKTIYARELCYVAEKGERRGQDSVQDSILGKIHVDSSRNDTIIPGIKPVAPVVGSTAADVIDDAAKEVNLPPSRCRPGRLGFPRARRATVIRRTNRWPRDRARTRARTRVRVRVRGGRGGGHVLTITSG